MGVDAGAAGAFGLYLPQFKHLQDVYKELQDYVKQVRDAESEDHPRRDPEDFSEISTYRDRLIAALVARYGIQVPPGAHLIWTGSEDERPARCTTPAEQWVLGWGLLTRPWEYPNLDASFRNHAGFHDWVWMG